MKHSYRTVALTNGPIEEEILLFDFDEEYKLLTTFLLSDVTPFEEWIKEDFDKVLSGQSECVKTSGNLCGIEICPDTTKVYDLFAEDAMGNWCEVDTRELRLLIEEWCDKRREFRNRNRK